VAVLSDSTIVNAIKTLIEAESSLYNADGPNNPTLINKVYTEPNLEGLAERNYCEIMAPGGNIKTNVKGGVRIRQMGDTNLVELTGDMQMTVRPFTVLFKFKQVRRENNARIYDAVMNFRSAVKADETLSTTGVDGAVVSSWGYTYNKKDQTIKDGAVITLTIMCTESF